MAEVTLDTHQGENKPWWEGLDAETKGYVQARGLHNKEMPEALALTIQAHRNAEQKLGIPTDRVFAWPGADDKDGMAKVFEKLGVPAEASAYDFSAVKKADGSPLDQQFQDFMRTVSKDLRLTPEQAAKAAENFWRRGESAEKEAETATKTKIALAQQALDANWGANAETNKFIAGRAAQALGLDAEFVANIAQTAGYATMMEGLRKIGVGMGEGKLLGINDGTGSQRSGAMTKEEAASRRTDLMADKEFCGRWLKGEKAAVEELAGLDKIMVGPPR